jgi:hypothetical protein
MSSEWMKVMLEEISRKKAESEQARAEELRREDERHSKADPARHVEQMVGDRPAVPAQSGADRARG